MWHNNVTVVRTHAKHGTQMAWAIFGGIAGWKRIRPLAPDGVTNVFMILCAALANGRRVDVFLNGNYVEQATLR